MKFLYILECMVKVFFGLSPEYYLHSTGENMTCNDAAVGLTGLYVLFVVALTAALLGRYIRHREGLKQVLREQKMR